MASAASSLTGLWSGLYWYDTPWDPAVDFIATLTDQDGAISGWVSEPDSITFSGMRLSAFISGTVSGADVQFAKTYDGDGPLAHRVDYAGTISDDRCAISGRWTLEGECGGFRMTRPMMVADEQTEDIGIEEIAR